MFKGSHATVSKWGWGQDISKLANEIHKQKKERKTKKPNTQGWKFPKIQGGGLL